MISTTHTSPGSRSQLWVGRILTAFVVLFLVFDGIEKVLMVPAVMSMMAPLGYPNTVLRAVGIILLICTALYAIPRTSVLGAVLLTAYLGGATASFVRVGQPLGSTLFPVTIAVIAWAAIFLRERRLRSLIPLRY